MRVSAAAAAAARCPVLRSMWAWPAFLFVYNDNKVHNMNMFLLLLLLGVQSSSACGPGQHRSSSAALRRQQGAPSRSNG
jgi:hypothetical protein